MAAIRYLSQIQPVLKEPSSPVRYTIGFAFRLHSKTTAAFLLAASLLVMATEFWGPPILCITTLPKNFVNTYCWITSTFTMPDQYYREIGEQASHPGVLTPDGERRYHNYYQWVPIVLGVWALAFYAPFWMWKKTENSVHGTATKDLTSKMFIYFGQGHDAIDAYVSNFISRLEVNISYVYMYIFCEMWAFINCVSMVHFIDWFLGGEFLTYGLKVFDYAQNPQDQRVDPMIYIFPRVTKCTFQKYGPSGTLEIHDSQCILSQNIVNEKIFIFLWFWFYVLSILLAVTLVFRIAMCSSHFVRSIALQLKCKGASRTEIEYIVENISVNNWWMLYNTSHCVHERNFKGCLSKIYDRIYEINSEEIELQEIHSSLG